MTTGRHEQILWVVAALVSLGYGQFPDGEYCSHTCPRGKHTLCKYKPVGPNCGQVQSLMSENGRMKILSLHNSFRNAMASGEMRLPASSNMRQMYWDLELEAIAERWAQQCNASYNDECRDVNRFPVGQIMSKSHILSQSVNYYEALLTKLWFSESVHLNAAVIGQYHQQREVRHIAQILFANAMRIGCADVLYSTVDEPKSVRVTICNYGPMISSSEGIYRTGTPCSECPERTECRDKGGPYPYLCTEKLRFQVVEPDRKSDEAQMEAGEVDREADEVQREPDESESVNRRIAVDSKIFPRGAKRACKNCRKNKENKDYPEESDYDDSEAELEEGDDSSYEYEGEGVGMGRPRPKPKPHKGKPHKQEQPRAATTKPPDGTTVTTAATTAAPASTSNPEVKPADVFDYLIGYTTIFFTTIVLERHLI